MDNWQLAKCKRVRRGGISGNGIDVTAPAAIVVWVRAFNCLRVMTYIPIVDEVAEGGHHDGGEVALVRGHVGEAPPEEEVELVHVPGRHEPQVLREGRPVVEQVRPVPELVPALLLCPRHVLRTQQAQLASYNYPRVMHHAHIKQMGGRKQLE